MPTFQDGLPSVRHADERRRGFTMVQLLAAIGIVAVSMTVCLPAIPAHEVVEDDGPINIHAFVCRATTAETDVEIEVREILVELEMRCLVFVTSDDGWYEFSVTTNPSHTNDETYVRLRERLPATVELRVL